MKTMKPSAAVFLSLALLVHLGTGCTSSRNYSFKCQPMTDYPQRELINLSAALELRDSFAGGVVFERAPLFLTPGTRYQIPGALETSSEALVRALFKRVVVVKGPASALSEPYDIVITPRAAKGEEHYDLKGGVTLLFEWTVTRPDGQLVWKRTVQGDGTGSLMVKPLVQRAMEDAFRKSYEAMSASPELRALSKPR